MIALPILALDISGHCGWAMRFIDGSVTSGVWELGATNREWVFSQHLDAGFVPAVVVIEKPIIYGHAGRRARGSLVVLPLVGVARRYAQKHWAEYMELAPATVKKYATGNGRASKAEVISAMSIKFGIPLVNDNQADALAVLAAYTSIRKEKS